MQDDPDESGLVREPDASDSLVANWKFNERTGGVLIDSSDNSYDGVVADILPIFYWGEEEVLGIYQELSGSVKSGIWQNAFP